MMMTMMGSLARLIHPIVRRSSRWMHTHPTHLIQPVGGFEAGVGMQVQAGLSPLAAHALAVLHQLAAVPLFCVGLFCFVRISLSDKTERIHHI